MLGIVLGQIKQFRIWGLVDRYLIYISFNTFWEMLVFGNIQEVVLGNLQREDMIYFRGLKKESIKVVRGSQDSLGYVQVISDF